MTVGKIQVKLLGETCELSPPASVVLTVVPMEGFYGGTVCVLIDVPEETALPYEERVWESERCTSRPQALYS